MHNSMTKQRDRATWATYWVPSRTAPRPWTAGKGDLVPALVGAPVRIPKAAVVVAAQLRRGIVRGEFEPGDALPNETELMHIYGVSRPVVREALRIIESESLIAVKRGAGGGARVRRPDIGVAARHAALLLQIEGATLSDLFEARETLEPDAVRRLAERRQPEAIRRLRESHEEGLRLVHDPTAYAVHAARFHEELSTSRGTRPWACSGACCSTSSRSTTGRRWRATPTPTWSPSERARSTAGSST